MRFALSILCLLALAGAAFAHERNDRCPRLAGEYAFSISLGATCTLVLDEAWKTFYTGDDSFMRNHDYSGHGSAGVTAFWTPRSPDVRLVIEQNDCAYRLASTPASRGEDFRNHPPLIPESAAITVPTVREWYRIPDEGGESRYESDEKSLKLLFKRHWRGGICGLLPDGYIPGCRIESGWQRREWTYSLTPEGSLKMTQFHQEPVIRAGRTVLSGGTKRFECVFPRISTGSGS